MSAGTVFALDVFARIGRDHELRREALASAEAVADDPLPAAWALYERHWRRFCGTRLDPQGWQVEHPARLTGGVRIERGAPVVVVGTGPSLAGQMGQLRRHRAGVYVVTSPRGARALAAAGIAADLVLVEHQTAIDAQHSVNDLAHRSTDVVAGGTIVAAEARTPPGLLRDVPSDRLFVPDPLPTWGHWPATAVALAVLWGAGTVALLGVDLGRTDAPDPQHAPLRELLTLFAQHAGVTCLDLGVGGATKAHWSPATLDALGLQSRVPPLGLDVRPWSTAEERRRRLAGALDRLAPLVAHAEETLGAALAVRDGAVMRQAVTTLETGFDRLLDAAASRGTRVDVQDVLGVSFLPRFWRTRPSPSLGAGLWRPAAMACHEIVRQDRALRRLLERAA